MSAEQELFYGPVMPWEPGEKDKATIANLLESDDPLNSAYGQAYLEGFFVKEFGGNDETKGITAVGELNNIAVVEFRRGIVINPQELTMGDCVELGAYPGTGDTRAERVLDVLEGARKLRQEAQNHKRIKQLYE